MEGIGTWQASKDWLLNVLPQLSALTVRDHPHRAPVMGLALSALRRCRCLCNLRRLALQSSTSASALSRVALPVPLGYLAPSLTSLSLRLTLPASMIVDINVDQ